MLLFFKFRAVASEKSEKEIVAIVFLLVWLLPNGSWRLMFVLLLVDRT